MIKAARIYKITCKCCDKVYIGSTTLSLRTRFLCHKSAMKDEKKANNKLYSHMNEKGSDSFKIETIYELIIDDSREILKRENDIILENDSVNEGLNSKYAIPITYNCNYCGYATASRSAYNKHCETNRHLKKLDKLEKKEDKKCFRFVY